MGMSTRMSGWVEEYGRSPYHHKMMLKAILYGYMNNIYSCRKIESKANKYTFVWRKSTEKNRAKLMEKIKVLLEQVDNSIAQENGNEDEPLCFTPGDLRDMAERLNKTLEAKPEPSTKEDKEKRKEERQQNCFQHKENELENQQKRQGKAFWSR